MAQDDFYSVLSAAIDDMLAHGFDDIERVNAWTRKIREAAERSLIRPESLEQRLRDALASRYRKLVDDGEIERYHEGIDRFTLDRIKPALRGELDRRIAASANLIKLNRTESVEKTLRRFQGWSTSLPPGGVSGESRAEVRTNVRASMKSLPFEERRVIIDQSHKLFGAINEIVASDGGAIAGRWRSNYRQPGYNYRPEHKERDNEIYLIRDSWAHRAGLVKKGGNPYVDEITAPGQEPFCRCLAPSTEILYARGISVISRRHYDGPCLKIITAALPERPLTITPNHPVLTSRGWVAAQTLNVGDDLIELIQENIPPSPRVNNENNRPPTVAEIFETAAKANGVRTIRDSSLQFHGDGVANGYVDIVRPAWPLSFNVDSRYCRRQISLTETNDSASRFRSVRDMGGGLWAAGQSFFRSLRKMGREFLPLPFIESAPTAALGFALFEHRNFALFRAALAVSEAGCTGVSSDVYSALTKAAPDCRVADFELLCKNHGIPARQIRLAKILDIKRKLFSGHVYNLQTDGEWYSAERIISHNCYYIFIYSLRELPGDMQTAKGKEALAQARGQEEVRAARMGRADDAGERADAAEKPARGVWHLSWGRPNALGGWTQGTWCNRMQGGLGMGMNCTDNPAEVTCTFCKNKIAARGLPRTNVREDEATRLDAIEPARAPAVGYEAIRRRLERLGNAI